MTASSGSQARISASVGAGDDLEDVTGRILEVQPAAAVVTVDLVRLRRHRIGPVRHPARPDSREYRIELRLADEKRVVLDGERLVGRQEVEADSVLGAHHQEVSEG